MKTKEQLIEELQACSNDEVRWAYVLVNKDEDELPPVTLDNDATYISFVVEVPCKDSNETEEDWLTIDFDGYLGWSEGVRSLLNALGIKAECC